MEDNSEQTDINQPCKICRKEEASVLGGYCPECYKKYVIPRDNIIQFCPECTKELNSTETKTILDLLSEYNVKLEFRLCQDHENKEDSAIRAKRMGK